MEKSDTVEVLGQSYRAGTMNAMKQFHVVRRLGPLLAGMGITATQLKSFGSGKFNVEEAMTLMLPLMGALGAMENEQVEFIINTCLTAVERKDGERWAPVTTPEGRLMYEDIDMVGMLALTFLACRHNILGFLPGLSALTSSLGPSAPTQGQQTT